MAVDIVIFARAWFSDSEMNFSLTPGFAFTNSDDSFCASAICELDTRAIVTSFSDAPRLPAPAQPDVRTKPAATVNSATRCRDVLRALRTLFTFASLSAAPTANEHSRCHKPTSGRAFLEARRVWRGAWP